MVVSGQSRCESFPRREREEKKKEIGRGGGKQGTD